MTQTLRSFRELAQVLDPPPTGLSEAMRRLREGHPVPLLDLTPTGGAMAGEEEDQKRWRAMSLAEARDLANLWAACSRWELDTREHWDPTQEPASALPTYLKDAIRAVAGGVMTLRHAAEADMAEARRMIADADGPGTDAEEVLDPRD